MPDIRTCHWCNKPNKNVQLVTESKTHGICPDCLRRHFGLTVEQMYRAQAVREEQTKFERLEKSRKRRAAKSYRKARAR